MAEVKSLIYGGIITLIVTIVSAIFLKLAFPSTVSYLLGIQPNVDAYAGCKLITSNTIKNVNFSVNNSNDYYADIYTLRNSDPLTNAVIEINLPLSNDIRPVGFQSFPYYETEIQMVSNKAVDTMIITARWENVAPKSNRKLMIFYNTTPKISGFLKSEPRGFYYAGYTGNSKKEDTKKFTCPDFDYFYDELYH